MKKTVAFVEVHDETLHREVYRNKVMRIYRAILKPGAGTDFHRHSEDTIYIALKGGSVATELMKGSPSCPTRPVKSLTMAKRLSLLLQKTFCRFLNLDEGFVFYMPSKKKPVIHKAIASRKNKDDMDLLGIEIFYSAIAMGNNQKNNIRREMETDEIAVYRLYLQSRQELHEILFTREGILFVLSGRSSMGNNPKKRTLSRGKIFWINDKSIHRIKDLPLEGIELLLVHLKTPRG